MNQDSWNVALFKPVSIAMVTDAEPHPEEGFVRSFGLKVDMIVFLNLFLFEMQLLGCRRVFTYKLAELYIKIYSVVIGCQVHFAL